MSCIFFDTTSLSIEYRTKPFLLSVYCLWILSLFQLLTTCFLIIFVLICWLSVLFLVSLGLYKVLAYVFKSSTYSIFLQIKCFVLKFSSLTYFDFSLIHSEIYESRFSLLYVNVQFSRSTYLTGYVSSGVCFWPIAKDHVPMFTWDCFWFFHSIGLHACFWVSINFLLITIA